MRWLLLLIPLLTLGPGAVRADRLDESMAALDESDVEHAARLLSAVSQEEQRSARGMFQRGMLDFLRGNYAAAEALLEKAIADSPRSPHLGDFRKLREWAHAAQRDHPRLRRGLGRRRPLRGTLQKGPRCSAGRLCAGHAAQCRSRHPEPAGHQAALPD